jgi:hypothetical protein
MKRRSLLASAGALCLLGCASKKPKAQLKPNDLRSIGMLPVKEWVDKGSTAQFSVAANPVPANAAAAPPPISPSMLGMAIGQSIRASRDAERAALASALSPVAFDPRETLIAVIQRELDRRAVSVVPIKGGALAERVRNNSLKDLPTDVDAILDVQIHSAGYYPLGKGKGFSPYASVTARLLDTINPGETIEEFSYGGDSSESDGDARYFQLPPGLVQPALADFSGNASTIRTAFEALFDQIATKLVDDVVRVRDKLPRLD